MTNDQLWQAALGELELILSRANFTTWFKNTAVIEVGDDSITVAVPNTFTKTWLEKKYHQAISAALQNVTQQPIRQIVYRVQQQTPSAPITIPVTAEATHTQQPTPTSDIHGLNLRYQFENFIVGKGNELAHAAALAVASRPGQSYNPLFIYGGVGLGKTHLLQAIGLSLQKKNSRILYVSSEKFTNDYIQSVRAGQGKEFKERYRNVDILLIDDIQFIAGKEGTQEEFFHTFNHLHQNNRQIVMTSDRPPKAIPALEARLLSRFEWGMIADISQPDLETRIAILETKCRERNVAISRDALTFVATAVQNNVRELEGALNRIIAEISFSGITPDLDTLKKLFSTIERSIPRPSVQPRQLIDAVCQYYNIGLEDLVGKSRKRELVIPRQISMYLLREETRASFPSIGQELGNRDHTTVMHACDKIKDAVETDERIRQDVRFLRQQLYATP